jgi:aspartate carbamoyltransferase catalytic subunit
MTRIFYTERDIEDMAKRGVTEIQVNDSVYITDLARETMDKLGIKRKVSGTAAASSSVLASPDVAHLHTPPPAPASVSNSLSASEKQEVIEKVKSGVIARLGPGVDAAVVDKIVQRVVNAL